MRIPFLDNNTSYAFCMFLHFFIKAGMLIFSLFSVVLGYADFKKWKPYSIGGKILKLLTNLIIIVLMLFCIFFSIDGRYTKTDIGEHGDTHYTYFGKAKNGVRYGFGKLFNDENKIWVIADAKGDKVYENVKSYKTEDGITYLAFEGTLKDGKREEYGTYYRLINGEIKQIYQGGFRNDHFHGEGVETSYYPKNGVLQYQYEGSYLYGNYNGYGELEKYDDVGHLLSSYKGGWANGKKYGYGIEIKYNTDGEITEAYRGTYWDGMYFGEGINEYYSTSGSHIVWRGWMTDGEITENGAYYYSSGNFIPVEKNGSSIHNQENDEWTIDEAKKAELMREWPFPDELLIVD